MWLLISVVTRVLSEARRLDAEELAAEELLQARHAAFAEAQKSFVLRQQELEESLARLSRVRKQRRSLISKGNEMVRLNQEALEGLDEVVAETSETISDVQSLVHTDLIDWSRVDLSSLDFDPSLLSDVAHETPSAGAAHG